MLVSVKMGHSYIMKQIFGSGDTTDVFTATENMSDHAYVPDNHTIIGTADSHQVAEFDPAMGETHLRITTPLQGDSWLTLHVPYEWVSIISADSSERLIWDAYQCRCEDHTVDMVEKEQYEKRTGLERPHDDIPW